MYSVYVLCIVNKKKEKREQRTTINGVLVARGDRENSNPAKTTTHSGTVEKETHFINVVGMSLIVVRIFPIYLSTATFYNKPLLLLRSDSP